MMDDTVEKVKVAEVLRLIQEIAIELQNEGKDVSPLYQSSPDKWFNCYSNYLRSFQKNFKPAHAVLRIDVRKHRNVEVRYYIHYPRIAELMKKHQIMDKLYDKKNEIRKYIADKLSAKYQQLDERRWDVFLFSSKSVSWDNLINNPKREKANLKTALIEIWADFDNVFKAILEPKTVVSNVKKEEVKHNWFGYLIDVFRKWWSSLLHR